jgi:hypothetical protein
MAFEQTGHGAGAAQRVKQKREADSRKNTGRRSTQAAKLQRAESTVPLSAAAEGVCGGGECYQFLVDSYQKRKKKKRLYPCDQCSRK